MTDLFRDRRDFGDTIDTAAGQLGIDAAIIEKDYWVSQVLRALGDTHGSDFIFKGGTSLSKGYGIIQRFSEDVDILVLPDSRGSSARDTLMKAMAQSAAAAIGSELGPSVAASTGVHRSYDLDYPVLRRSEWLAPTVRLEMGIRGGPTPNSSHSIGSLLGDALERVGVDPDVYGDLAPFDIQVLHPARTLIEKLALVNGLADACLKDSSRQIHSRDGRHLYDIFELLGDGPTLALLADREQFSSIVMDCERVSREYFRAEYKRPRAGYAHGPAVTATGDLGDRLRSAFAQAEEMYFGRNPYPSWEDVVERIRENEALL